MCALYWETFPTLDSEMKVRTGFEEGWVADILNLWLEGYNYVRFDGMIFSSDASGARLYVEVRSGNQRIKRNILLNEVS